VTRLTRLASSIAVAVGVAVAMRSPLGDAIIARGDEALRAGRYVDAIRYYRRATYLTGPSEAVLERDALLALIAPSRIAFEAATKDADAFVAGHRSDALGYYDRGLVEWKERSYLDAERDFGTASSLGQGTLARSFQRASARRLRRRP